MRRPSDPSGAVPVAIVNDRLGLGFEVVTKKEQLPCLYQWQHFQPGNYVMGIEPSSHHVLGDNAARERGEMIWLEHDEGRSYDVIFRVLEGEETSLSPRNAYAPSPSSPRRISQTFRPLRSLSGR